ncbi:uncharacterized protein MONOS_16229 [Monocercomonoides exilis]|uniref:uncharacterized protein n=1 Tax=Monocercomonoides exilis TaxID=2049356 RepID=UPI00355A756E|nr:hypothetical protein MONOS_16229 [Monocercomonoides exilis]|eukprot:MONOS_16229.1-p1 / transcript=MONOS_16229.1 / gene=MONOS_16229 / organism=Monocercomonoides_exilis_PA203 / gene_product=unspecified product / transcript_product=unspecified product / location=Mono_scaffold01577:488-1018(+) / protein_length=148 / sequence_SO=supercontig / SO=protein_coding / is_pseudo=false
MSAAAMNEIEIRLRILVPEAARVYARHKQMLLQKLSGYVEARWAVLFGGIVRTSDVVLSVMFSITLVAPLPSIDEYLLMKSGSKNIFVVELSRRVVVMNKVRGSDAESVCSVKSAGKVGEMVVEAERLKMEYVNQVIKAIELVVLEE